MEDSMKNWTPYVLTDTEKTRCPHCGANVTLLSHARKFEPAFYICWHCRKVFQVGVGEVQKESL
jgi:DNA-directed RNA polymerase subunit RPC12/RpoP